MNPKDESSSFYQELLDLALLLGNSLARNGAETSRVEDSVRRVLMAYGCQEHEVYALANNLWVNFRDPMGKIWFGQKYMHGREDDLSKFDELNQCSREICCDTPCPKEAMARIETIMRKPSYSLGVQLYNTMLVAFGFTCMMGGSWKAGLYSVVITVIMRLALEPLMRQKTNRLFINITGGMIITLLAWPCGSFGLSSEMNTIISGSLMYLFPGLAVMNSIRDLVASDYLAGITKLVEAVLLALSIAAGSGIMISIIGHFG